MTRIERRTGQMLVAVAMVWSLCGFLVAVQADTAGIHRPAAFASLQPSTRRSLASVTTSRTRFSRSSPLFESPLPEVYNADREERAASAARRSKSNAADDPEWKFFDTARVNVSGGDGGTGCVAFRREKGEPLGGPNGGRGGRGGSVYLEADATLNTLMPCRQRVHVRAKNGRNGAGKKRDGVGAGDIIVPVPPGTLVRDLKTQKLAGELREPGDRLLVAKGGRGGRGNAVSLLMAVAGSCALRTYHSTHLFVLPCE